MSALRRLKGVWSKRQYWKWLIRDERRSPHRPGPVARWRAWRHGFLSANYRWFGLEGKDSSDYLTDRMRYLRTTSLNAPYAGVLDDKLVFHEVFRRHAGLLPEAYALLRRGTVAPLSRSEPVSSIEDALRVLGARRRLVLKPTTGGGGAGVRVLEDLGDGRIAIGGEPRTAAEARGFLRGLRGYLLIEHVASAAYSRAIYPGSTNTLRILTVWDDETGEAFLPYALHRFGTSRSGGVDNVSRGGVAANLDVETGRMDALISVGSDGRPAYSAEHPETGARVEGVIVPGWREVAARMLELAGEHAYLPYVGWDVVVTESGPRVLEGNSFTGAEFFQLRLPLLAHPRLGRYFRRHGVAP